ncbi:MAG: glycosyltransferase family 2 protein [Nanoarchaeota archaeon]|nr:glycosyltransferase family 2 protein [Nanoarchaeota archaeon]
MKLSIVIPCYNEEKGIPNLVKQLDPICHKLIKDYELELIFVDDGSKDKTNALLNLEYKNKGYVKIIRHRQNMNLGAALRTGFKNATGDLIAVLDSDCTYPPGLIIEMLNLVDNDTDIVTVSPYHPDGGVENVPYYRVFLSKGISNIYRLLIDRRIHTYGAMVRIYKKKVIEKIRFRSDDFLSVTEIMVKSLLKGYHVKEFPTILRVRQYGQSSMRLISVILSHLYFLTRIILLRIAGVKL